jgi:hypothetical protein
VLGRENTPGPNRTIMGTVVRFAAFTVDGGMHI